MNQNLTNRKIIKLIHLAFYFIFLIFAFLIYITLTYKSGLFSKQILHGYGVLSFLIVIIAASLINKHMTLASPTYQIAIISYLVILVIEFILFILLPINLGYTGYIVTYFIFTATIMGLILMFTKYLITSILTENRSLRVINNNIKGFNLIFIIMNKVDFATGLLTKLKSYFFRKNNT